MKVNRKIEKISEINNWVFQKMNKIDKNYSD